MSQEHLDTVCRNIEAWHSVWDVTIDVDEIRDLGDTVLALGRVQALDAVEQSKRVP